MTYIIYIVQLDSPVTLEILQTPCGFTVYTNTLLILHVYIGNDKIEHLYLQR